MYITIDEIVREACADDGDTLHLYPDYLRYALRGVRVLTTMLGIPLSCITEFLPINPNNTVDLPKNYVDYQKIGVLLPNGNISVLDLNDKISLTPVVDDCNTPVETFIDADPRYAEGISVPYYFSNFFRNGRNVGALYGHGGGYNRHGAYRPNIDREAWQIQLSSHIRAKYIVLEYASNGMNPDGETTINEMAYEAELSFIKWQRDESKRALSLSEKERSKNQFYDDARRLKHNMNSFTMEEFKAATRKNFQQSIKN